MGREGPRSRHRPPAPAFDLGITFFDTADTYNSGRRRDHPPRSPRRRAATTSSSAPSSATTSTTTRIGPDQQERPHDWSPGYMRKALEGSLRRLGTDHIDLYQLHNPRIDAIAQRRPLGRAREGEGRGPHPRLRRRPWAGLRPAPGRRGRRRHRASAARRRRSSTTCWSRTSARGSSPSRTSTDVSVIARVPHASGLLDGRCAATPQFEPGDHRNWRVTTNEKRKAWLEDGLLKLEQLPFLEEGRTIGQAAIQFILHEPSIASVLPNIYEHRQASTSSPRYDSARAAHRGRVRARPGAVSPQLRPRSAAAGRRTSDASSRHAGEPAAARAPRPDGRPRPERPGHAEGAGPRARGSSSTTPSSSSTRRSGACPPRAVETAARPNSPALVDEWSDHDDLILRTYSLVGPARRLRLHALAHLERPVLLPGDVRPQSTARSLGAYLTPAVQLPLAAEALAVREPHRGLGPRRGGAARRGRVPVRLPVREDARLVRPHAARAPGHDGRAHRRRQPVQGRAHQHQLQLRHRRPGVRRLVRFGLPAGVRRPRGPAALHRGQPLHPARHADVHLREGGHREIMEQLA